MTITHVGPAYTIHAGSTLLPADIEHLDFNYTGQTPSALTSAAAITLGVPIPITLSSGSLTSVVVCFARGTLIRTPRGDAPIETLQAGDMVVTASGEFRPIQWIGHRVMDCRNHPNPDSVWPVRIAADAIAPNRPSRDLFVSPAHTLCIDLVGETLIHAGNLLNGASVAQIEVDSIEYWHIELDSHDLLVANNLAAESYLEMANRAFFAERTAADGDEAGALRTHDDFCRPVMKDEDDLAFVRRRLAARAEAIGWTRSHEADLRLLVDGEMVLPVPVAGGAMFAFDAGARDVRLTSNTFTPNRIGGADPRCLGVSLMGLALIGADESRAIPLADPRLESGLHPEEGRDGAHWRWTRGEVRLHPDFFAGMTGEITLRVLYDDSATRSWIAPARATSRPALRLV